MFLTGGSADLPGAAFVVRVALAGLLRTGRGSKGWQTSVSCTEECGEVDGLMALGGCARGRMPLRCTCAGQACRCLVFESWPRACMRGGHTLVFMHACHVHRISLRNSMRTSPS